MWQGQVTGNICQVTGDRWQGTGDTWHVTCDRWHVIVFASSAVCEDKKKLCWGSYGEGKTKEGSGGYLYWRWRNLKSSSTNLKSCFLKKIFSFGKNVNFFVGSTKNTYRLQQPGCILCLKLVIICFILSHFCDLFWIVTMIMNICFIRQFCGYSNNFAPVLQQQQKIL